MTNLQVVPLMTSQSSIQAGSNLLKLDPAVRLVSWFKEIHEVPMSSGLFLPISSSGSKCLH